jgi:histone H4
MMIFLENVLRDTITYAEHARRHTIKTSDVVQALRRNGRPIYCTSVNLGHDS